MAQDDLIETINQLLPQTQCGLCSYAGCKPYAQAMVEQGEVIDRCLPGGISTLQTLGQVLNIDANPYLATMREKQKPAQIVTIREDECIGCTKCIQACPVDAIVGSGKQMHTVIASECTGCELCIAPCPVDCIDLISLAETHYDKTKAQHRYVAKQQRALIKQDDLRGDRGNNTSIDTQHNDNVNVSEDIIAKRDYIAMAVERAQLKKRTTTA